MLRVNHLVVQFVPWFALPCLMVAAGCGPTATTQTVAPTRPVACGPDGGEPIASSVSGVSSTTLPALPVDPGGLWLLNNFPSERVQREHGFQPSKEWLENVRLASVRLAQGCSGSFVSPSGLIMTNHHCAHHCIEQISSAKKDYDANGFYAAAEKDEVKCPDMEVNQLVDITDVTQRMSVATKELSGKEYNSAQKGEMSKIEKECATGDDVRCDVVSLYHGGMYQLYKYRRYQDVRLVMSPEFAIAFFGGDPDNFMFPRYDLDVSFVRVYQNGKPASTNHYFPWSTSGAKEGDLTFVSGHPGRTSRNLTMAELEYARDHQLPGRLLRLTEARGALYQFQQRGPEQKRMSTATLFYVENGIKALKGRRDALVDPAVWQSKVGEEKALRARVDSDPELKAMCGGAWETIAAAQAQLVPMRKPYTYLEYGAGFWSDQFTIARNLVRATQELTVPNEKRLREFVDSQMPAVKQQLFSTAPIYEEFEILTLTLSLTQMREELGADHPVVRKVLGKLSPQELAAALVKGSKLRDLKVRKALFDGGKAAVDASTDPMIDLARKIDVESRELRTRYEEQVEGPVNKSSELIARARFKVFGTSVYPDATFTLRLSYGVVKGWNEGGHDVKPHTTFGGAFERATGKSPFALPKTWLTAKDKLNLSTPFDFVTTNDIIGGNSGSPVINKEGQVVGLIFDGNIHSLGGDYAFDPGKNRAVAVSSEGLIEALDKVYGASRIRDELKSGKKK
jgi:hypothetical protein